MAIVAASVVAGSRVLASADDTVAVWVVGQDAAAGTQLEAGDLQSRRVRFADDADLARYVPVEETLPAELVLTRGVGAGELLPRAAIGSAEESDRAVLRIAVPEEQVPAAVGAGAVVDVYLLDESGEPAEGGQDAAADPGEPVLAEVGVLEAPGPGEAFSGTGNRTLDVAVTEEQARAWFEARGRVVAPVVAVVQVG
ncbi:hypothetical protein GCM10023226_39090 [Nocardioides nanhaiensis]|uniref:SAF domain-containing protein n=1 Tax=Nocardioides nanhaiensis TaxID=1476871 RepID=A0ABP8WWM5_9ACTN